MMHGAHPNRPPAFLQMLSPEAHAAFLRLGTPRRYARGDVLIQEGDHTQELVVLHEGSVKVTARQSRDREWLMDIRTTGDIVGEVAAMDDGPRSATVTACNDVSATVVPPGELKHFLLTHPDASLAFTSLVSNRLRRADRLRLELGGYQVPVRVARVLLELAESHGRPRWTLKGLEPNVRRISVDLSQSEFAALTACAETTVQKALADLRKKRIIAAGCRLTTINDMNRLREAAQVSLPRTQGHVT
ncbi:Crp/Fnr family transcriptional regulator [Streptomyces xiamenensis]|uniref:Crp/Fnr family transcriptional regulator n=1 Tax=Streptomyces xiamenensis TaxID=408015 RepID=UPI0037D3C86F